MAPADLPVQQATKFEFVINLKAAKQIRLQLSRNFSRGKIVGGKIVFCNVHAHAEMLLTTCRYARDFLLTLTPAEEKDRNMLREIVMPYLERQIAAAEKK